MLPTGPFRPMLAQVMETPADPMADIFISYASADRPTVRRLAEALEARGWSVWWDHGNLHGGQHFDRMIEDAISTARAVVVVWSPHSTKSDWVRAEAAQALEENKLVPVRIDGAVLPLRFRNIHTIDLAAWTGETDAEPFDRLVKDLSHYLGPPEHPGILTALHPRAAVPVGEDQQPARAAPAAEHPYASPDGSVPLASSIAPLPTSTHQPTSPTGRNRVGKYFAVVAAAGGILWGVVILKDRQPASTNPPVEATVSKPPEPKPPETPADAGAAQAAYDRGDYATALSSARPAAERNDPAAQYILGLLYENGQGVAQDDAEAARWYQKAADQGHAKAQHRMGRLYQNTLDYAEALRWYQKAADQGNADSQNNIGKLYYNGWSVPQDYAEALRWYQKAGDQGNATAQYNIGSLYEHGRGVAEDRTEAARWYQKAAGQGLAVAQNKIGKLYENGYGVAEDRAEAARWYRKAADQGDAEGQYNTGRMYALGWGVARDMAQARAWMQKAAAAGDEAAGRWLEEY
jgi:TPR repeat protein